MYLRVGKFVHAHFLEFWPGQLLGCRMLLAFAERVYGLIVMRCL